MQWFDEAYINWKRKPERGLQGKTASAGLHTFYKWLACSPVI